MVYRSTNYQKIEKMRVGTKYTHQDKAVYTSTKRIYLSLKPSAI